MKTFLKNKAVGFYLLLVAIVLAIISTISYWTWGTENYAMNTAVFAAMVSGVLINLLLLFADSDYLVIALTALYSTGLFQLLADNAGSFADAYQGIVMFGDPTQVGAVLAMAAMIFCSVLLTIASGFIPRKKA